MREFLRVLGVFPLVIGRGNFIRRFARRVAADLLVELMLKAAPAGDRGGVPQVARLLPEEDRAAGGAPRVAYRSRRPVAFESAMRRRLSRELGWALQRRRAGSRTGARTREGGGAFLHKIVTIGRIPLVPGRDSVRSARVGSGMNSARGGFDLLRLRYSPWLARGIAAAGGGVAALGHVPFAVWAALPAAMVVAMVLVVLAPRIRSAAAIGWAFGAGYFIVALHWLVQPFLVDVARHGWMAPFALLFMAGGLALFWAAAFGAAAWLARRRWRPLALVVTLSLAEWLRATVLSGFPWAMPAYVWSETPLIHAAAWVGPFGVTGLTLLLSAGIALSLRREWSMLWALAGALPLVGVGALGWWEAREPLLEAQESPVIRLVQPNAPQDEKWDPERAVTFVDRQVALTAETPAPDLVVWPETAIPWSLGEAGPVLARASEAAGGVPVILGVVRLAGQRAYNSLVVVGEGGEVLSLYDKHHLVPFGEYIPLGGLARLVGLRSFAAQDGYGYTAGEGPARLDLGWMGQPLPLICYEAIFPAEVGQGERPGWMLQITNDAWFGKFSGPYQHLAQARFRAVEQGVPMIRVANTGVSAVIDARGGIVTSIPLGQGGYVDAALPPAAPPTLYSRTGDAPTLVLLLLGLGGLILSRNAR